MASIVKVKGARGVRFQYSLQVNGKQERKTFETKAECEAAHATAKKAEKH